MFLNLTNKAKLLLPIGVFGLVLLGWELLTRFGSWNPQVFPGPIIVAASMWELARDGTLFKHAVASLFRVSAGYYLAVLAGIPLGILLGRWRAAGFLLNPVIQFLRPISPLAWIPLAMLWLGIGDSPAVFLIFLSSFFPMVLAAASAVNEINPTYFQVAANFNFSRSEEVTRIILPAILPSVLTALRITAGIAWLVVVAAEMIAVKSGLGYLILDSRNALRMDYVMVGMITIGAIGLLIDLGLKRLDRFEETRWICFHDRE